jgi:1-deoxy-D-xylulose-5-phosphate reductoisomerase
MDAFPALRLGIDAGRAGGVSPAVFNAANEEAVALFLDGDIPFGGIPAAIERALTVVQDTSPTSRDLLMDADRRARALVRGML